MQVSALQGQSDRSGTISVGGAQIACNLYLKKHDLLIFDNRVDWGVPYKEKSLVVGTRTLNFFSPSFVAEVFQLIPVRFVCLLYTDVVVKLI